MITGKMADMKTCSRCDTARSHADFYADKSKPDGRHSICKECVKADRRERYASDPGKYKAQMRTWAASEAGRASVARRYRALRDAALDAYGNRCACCGETEAAFLTVDHVGGWGAEHRKTTGVGNVYYWLKTAGYPQDGTIQLLCWNCNCAIGVRGACPHQMELT